MLSKNQSNKFYNFFRYIKKTNSYYQKRKERLRKKARAKYRSLSEEEEKEKRQKRSKKDIKTSRRNKSRSDLGI